MEEPEDERTPKEKALFYTTAFFILLGTFSLFAFLFLVPFVIDPAFTTIFMEFDETPATCQTVFVTTLHGNKNCTWASCREGCTKDIYVCTQIYVNYSINRTTTNPLPKSRRGPPKAQALKSQLERVERDVRDYDYMEGGQIVLDEDNSYIQSPSNDLVPFIENGPPELIGLMPNDSYWYYTGAKLFPNVKGCGYPPILNCTIWTKKYITIGTNFSCYYSRVDPMLVMSDLDMWQNTLNLVYAMAIPIPSFIISVIYLTFAYFKIYNEEEEDALLDKNAEGILGEEEEVANEGEDVCVDVVIPNGTTPLSASGPLTPNSDINSFGHQLKVKMADEMSRGSLDAGVISNSGSLQGHSIIISNYNHTATLLSQLLSHAYQVEHVLGILSI